MNPSPSSGPASDGPAPEGPAPQPSPRPAPAGSHPAGSGPAGTGSAGGSSNGSPSTGPAAPGEPGTSPTAAPGSGGFHSGFHHWVRSLGIVRGEDRWFGGVATGLAARTGLDPVLVRGLFVVLGIFGVGFLVYGVAWALLPEPDGRIHLEEAARGTWTSGMTGALIFAILGVGGPGIPFLGSESWFGGVIWTLLWIGSGVAFIYWFSTAKGRQHLSAHHPAADGSGAPGTSPGVPGTVPETSRGVSLAKPGTPAAGTGPSPAGPDTAGAEPAPGTVPPVAAPGAVPAGMVPPLPTAQQLTVPAGNKQHPSAAKEVPGAPGSYTAALFGAALLVGGAILALDYTNLLPLGNPVSVALAGAAAVFGVGIVILGLAGRHSGGIGTAAAAALVASLLTQGSMANANLVVASDAGWTPQNAAQASGGYTAVAANGTVDLRGTETSGDLEVPASVAAGNLAILVPDDVPVTVLYSMAAGNVEVNDGLDRQEYSGLWQPASERTLNDDADGDRITIDIRGLAGNVLVTTEESDL
ncbi:PspC domain-containing protein [Arthrobacter sp. zg-Y877]|uniref:PspC domain-containing protein n=1 Tax=Arthrobacter sp. zg-Y877 TaxID=3049074 RepID=UPI0025A495B4|nr:PspC domain-containing protein [Arthrobacter sp. zg-Y877]MDM7990048.1 PspC domain-containing protein [Arthrobacter sp. zg-Y877]